MLERIGLGVFLSVLTSPAEAAGDEREPFSLGELLQAGPGDLAPLEYLDASDGTSLAYRRYVPGAPVAALVFYHGGGAHSGAGYAHLAAGLRAAGIAVYTPDLRGHGASGGPRGDAPSPEQLWRDADAFVRHARAEHPAVPLFLGGHSSGAGLVLNYATWEQRAPTDGYLFLSPQLGVYSGAAREPDPDAPRRPFARVRTLPFVVHAMTGGRLMGHTHAVHLDYPPELLEADPGMVDSYTVNLASGANPPAPRDQFAALDRPFGLWIGADDELFAPEKVVAFGELAEQVRGESLAAVVAGQSHLGILVEAHTFLGPWLRERAAAMAVPGGP